MASVTFNDFIENEKPKEFFESVQPFMELMMQYQCAMMEIKTKFEVLDTEMSLGFDRNPIESISCRLKKTISIAEKLKRKGLDVSVENIEKHLHDVAGIRVICSFLEDIYLLADKICCQDDIRLVEKKDYIKNPKPNGYRSLHLILEVPVFFSQETKRMQVEVQLRTIAMDFWASLEHKLRYKKEKDDSVAQTVEELRVCAEEIHALDIRMQEISRQIFKKEKTQRSRPNTLSAGYE